MFLFRKKPEPPFVSAVVAAAGKASRMEGIDKQQAPLGSLPVIVRNLEALSLSGVVREIVLVCPPELIPVYFAMVKDYGLSLVSSVVGGGSSRQESVFAGIAACEKSAEYFAVHDGARPLADPELLADCLKAAELYGAAAPGITPRDTVKRVTEKGFAAATLPREELVLIQTPQVFEAGLYREAMAAALRDGVSCSDDCQLVERLGKSVFIVPGQGGNLKITTPEDLACAAAILRLREEGLECLLSE
ncbi:MAG: 2-C-methyl-D-erythritol 4-phosphate cytidylyltransferase [Oscillospiraceae bacterium]|nr:2-C-methyl-D-erythritol 4-phosphate cytidylyltransferase [Oscillospiraceae bacterium]